MINRWRYVMNIKFYKNFIILIFPIYLLFSNHTITGSNWNIKNGWIYKNNEKYFAIGLWNIPGYEYIADDDIKMQNIALFKDASKYFNIIYIQSGRQQNFMKTNNIFTGGSHFKWSFLKGFKGDIKYKTDKNGNQLIDYEEMYFIRHNLEKYYKWYIKTNIVEEIRNRFNGYDYIWFLADEPNTGGKGWFWHPRIMKEVNNAVHSINKSAITYIDLFGNIRGDRLAYEKNYIRKFGSMPASLPVGFDSETFMQGDPKKMDTYNYSYDGLSIYKYAHVKERWERRPIEVFRDKFFYNVQSAASAYDSCADVLGVNAYKDFYEYPEVAGETVQAIKAGCGDDKPVWLFFDAQAYVAQDRKLKNEEYFKNVKCQVYSSIVNGASGVLFWTNSQQSPDKEYWEMIKGLATELRDNSDIFKAKVLEKGYKEFIHYAIYELPNSCKNLILVNTSKTETQKFTISEFADFTLEPLAVKIISY